MVRKAEDVLALDLRGISTVTDFFVVAAGRSDVQVRAIAEKVVRGLREEGRRPSHVEGTRGGRWALADYGDMVVHVFHHETRDFYRLEELWGDAPTWRAEPASENEPAEGAAATDRNPELGTASCPLAENDSSG